MPASLRYILQQRPTIGGMARLALASATAPVRRLVTFDGEGEARRARKQIDPPRWDLVASYLEAVGAPPERYPGRLPPHLFPQWSYDLVARTMQHLTYPLQRLLNGGCRLEINGPLPNNTELQVEARLEEVDESPSRVRIHEIVETGPADQPEALVAHMYFILPRSGGNSEASGEDRTRPEVSEGMREVTRWSIPEDAGWEYAKLTGDFNPIHWIRPAARLAGFDNTILHGFATMARAMEGLNTAYFDGETPLETFDVQFTRPLVLPADVGLYVGDEAEPEAPAEDPVEVAVGDGPGESAYMVGTCTWS